MHRYTVAVLLAAFAMVAGCGEPVRGIDEGAKAAKAQARDAVNAAQEAAQHVDELSRLPIDQANPPH